MTKNFQEKSNKVSSVDMQYLTFFFLFLKLSLIDTLGKRCKDRGDGFLGHCLAAG